jgi:hypothetical protein
MKRYLVFLTIAAVIGLTAWPAVSAPSPKVTDAIWVINGEDARASSPTMRFGDTFSAGWQSSRTQFPWGLAQCWAAGASALPFWSSYRALQGDRTIGVFEFASADPSASWPADGASCTVSLVVKQGNRQIITATSEAFPVSA